MRYQLNSRTTSAKDLSSQREVHSCRPDAAGIPTFLIGHSRIGRRSHLRRTHSKPNAWSNVLAWRGQYILVKVSHAYGCRQDSGATVRSSDPGALIAAYAGSVRGQGYILPNCARWY